MLDTTGKLMSDRSRISMSLSLTPHTNDVAFAADTPRVPASAAATAAWDELPRLLGGSLTVMERHTPMGLMETELMSCSVLPSQILMQQSQPLLYNLPSCVHMHVTRPVWFSLSLSPR
jgi:hypothetical protein